jgi:PAS domain S-box-containing protein
VTVNPDPIGHEPRSRKRPAPTARSNKARRVTDAGGTADDLLDLVRESLVVCDLEGHILRWNKASERIYGWSGVQARGRQVQDILGDGYWPDAPRMDELRRGRFFETESRRKTNLGAEVIVSTQMSLRRDDVGLPSELVEAAIDVTATRRAEAAAQSAARDSEAFYTDMFHGSAFSAWHMDASRTWAIFHDLYDRGITDFRAQMAQDPEFIVRVMDGIRVVEVNDTTVRLFEASDRSDIVGGSIAPFWFPDRMETLLESLEAAFNGVPTYRGLGRMRTLAGNEIDVLFTRSATTALGSAGHVLLAIVDITDGVKAQNALAEMQANFAHAARVSSLGELTASIAHEVNQPLTAITANGEAALRWIDRPQLNLDKLRALTGAMIADARRASDVVAHVRSMASPQVGQHRRLSLTTLVNDALTLLRPQLGKGGLLTVLELNADLPDVQGDPVQLQQVIVNLILNALQALDGAPGSRLCLRAEAVSQAVVLTVEDNGPGIPEGNLDRLFTSFFTTKSDGMGIGLAICRTIVETHGGAISAKNAVGGGACFTVRLPLAVDAMR